MNQRVNKVVEHCERYGMTRHVKTEINKLLNIFDDFIIRHREIREARRSVKKFKELKKYLEFVQFIYGG